MKKALQYWFTGLLILLVASFFLVSCKANQPLQNTTVENNDTKTVLDTKETKTINQAILDEIILQIPQIYSSKKECDSLINFYRTELAKSIAASKISGDNSYILQYNEKLKQLELQIKIAQTENKETVKNIDTKTTYKLQKTIEVPVKLPLTWWENFFYRTGQILSVIVATYLFFKLNSKFKIV